MGNKCKPVIQYDDIELFIKINKFGFVDYNHIDTFCYINKKTRTKNDRVRQLVKYNYLHQEKTFIPKDYNMNYREGYRILCLGKEAIKQLKVEGHEVENNITRLRTNAPYRSYHQCQVASVCESIAIGYSDNSLSNFMYEAMYNEKESYNDNNYMQPDACISFKVKNTNSYILYFIEIERGYSSADRIQAKLNNYNIAIKNKIYDEKFGISIYQARILFISQTKSQKKDLIDKINIIDKYDLKILASDYQNSTKNTLSSIYYSFSKKDYCKLFDYL